ncbi:hypothetical protein GCM10007094_03060 [Pseudovibrio japonicus]|uniref:Uncharacterized protein n=1 Tax=Pseudovibrio japonicus TaxID=366534 RepID=A0ABQ3E0T4_9HYPH|nr:hypothetical protein [Pseudovibrio japonicus]GHB18673.1 hypothetical protein GCM10007094_03060 [Pseudovibrio japonicus]
MAVNPVQSISGGSEQNRTHGASSNAKTSTAEPFSLGELLDIVNPLQHIPGVNTLYRAITGDEASVRSRVAGSSLYGMVGGPLGMAGLVAGNLAEMKISGVLDAEKAQTESSTAVNIIERKISPAPHLPEPAADMASSLQRGIPILPVQSGDIPPLFGNVASHQGISMGQEDMFLEALSSHSERNEVTEADDDTATLPNVEKLSLDARNLLSEDLLKQLQERHRKTIAHS